MQQTIDIRRVRPEEHAAAGSLVRAAYEDDYVLGPDYLAEIEDVAGRDRDAEVLVALDAASGELLGTVTVPWPGTRLLEDSRDDEFDLRLLGVSRAARGRGVGEALMQHCADLARARGLHRIVLHTGEQMVAAHRLYERLGYARIDDRAFVIQTPTGPRRIFAYGLDIVAAPTLAAAAD